MSIKLREYLDANLLTHKEFANQAKINTTTIWSLLKGGKVSRLTAVKIQKATEGKVTLNDLGYQ